MNRKILLKTLLPISAIALLGGGIATSLTLTSCSNKSVFLNNDTELFQYLSKKSQKCPEADFTFNNEDSDEILNFIVKNYSKQACINAALIILYFYIFSQGEASWDESRIEVSNNFVRVWYESYCIIDFNILRWQSCIDCSVKIYIGAFGRILYVDYYPEGVVLDRMEVQEFGDYGTIITGNWSSGVYEKNGMFSTSPFDFTDLHITIE